MSLESLFHLHTEAVARAKALDAVEFLDAQEVLADHDRHTEAALAEVERLEKLIVGARASSLAAVAGKLRIALGRAEDDNSDLDPPWRLVESALRDVSLFVSAFVPTPAAESQS